MTVKKVLNCVRGPVAVSGANPCNLRIINKFTSTSMGLPSYKSIHKCILIFILIRVVQVDIYRSVTSLFKCWTTLVFFFSEMITFYSFNLCSSMCIFWCILLFNGSCFCRILVKVKMKKNIHNKGLPICAMTWQPKQNSWQHVMGQCYSVQLKCVTSSTVQETTTTCILIRCLSQRR